MRSRENACTRWGTISSRLTVAHALERIGGHSVLQQGTSRRAPAIVDTAGDVERSARAPRTIAEMVLWLIPLALSAVVYFPITQNYFFADDFVHLFRMENEGLLAYLMIPRGGHLLATFNAIFYASHALFGTHAEAYYWLPLFVHLLNVALLFSVIRSFTRSARLACFGAALWGVSPMNEGALGWFSVFGQALVATVLLYLLAQLARIADGRPVHRYAPALWCVLLLGACTSFGVGIGVTLVFPLVAFLLLPPSPTRTRAVRIFAALAVAVPGIYFGLSRLSFILYQPRTPPLIISWSVTTNLAMLAHLVGWGSTTLLLGQATSRLVYPGIGAFAIIAVFAAAALGTLIAAPPPVKRRLLACVVLCFGCYAMIVAGRAAFFANGAQPLMFVTPTRYHYAAPIPLAIALCVILAYFDTLAPLHAGVKNALLAGWVALVGGSYLLLGKPIDHHLAARRETERTVATIRAAIDAAGPHQAVHIRSQKFQGVGPIFVTRQDIFPGWAGVFVIFFPDNVVDDKPVFFETSDRDVLEAAQAGRRTATLLVEARRDG